MFGMVSDIQKFSLHDGPGIRTTVFLKGCNMRCTWCHNPETYVHTKDLLFYATKCIGCGACYRTCKTGALKKDDRGNRVYDKTKCVHCGACADVCAPQALKMIGTEMSEDEVLQIVLADQDYYTASSGGVTVSGGEPLMQADFVAELLKKCKDYGISTAIESNMSASFAEIQKVLPFLDYIFCDIKLIDEQEHKKYTGVSNKRTLENIAALKDSGIPLVVRTPMIPGITDSAENVRGIAAFLKDHANVQYYELLNYNPLAEAKAEYLASEYFPGKKSRKTKEEMEYLRQEAEKTGIPTIVGGD